MDPRSPAIEELVAELERMLGRLDDAQAGSEDTLACWERCARAFDRYRALQEEALDAGSPELRERVGHALRLHAVAVASADRRRQALTHDMAQLRSARDRIQAARNGAGASESRACDVRG